jgi:hypothetical protein
VGMTAIALYARPELAEKIRWIETAAVGVGWAEMGNKGAVATRLGLESSQTGEDKVVLTFVAAHLAPMEWDWERRNLDWKAICEGLVFERDGSSSPKRQSSDGQEEAEPLLSESGGATDGQSSLFSPVSHVFVAGDLNYRTSDTAPNPDDWKSWPQKVDSAFNMKDWESLWKGDQLSREMRKNKTLQNMAEAEIDFPPTYKHSSAAQREAKSSKAEETSTTTLRSLWAKHRVPSWCDRILYLGATPPKVHSYTALPIQPTSDHRPVSLSFSLLLEPLDAKAANVKSPFSIRKDWKEARAAARRNELVVGTAAYLGLTWEGEALLAGSVVGILGGYLALKTMLGS